MIYPRKKEQRKDTGGKKTLLYFEGSEEAAFRSRKGGRAWRGDPNAINLKRLKQQTGL